MCASSSVRMTHLDTPASPAQSVRVTQTRTFLIPGEATLAAETRAVLQQVGAALDEHRPLVVHNHGLVAVGQASPRAKPAKENGNDGKGKRGSASRSRERAARRQEPWRSRSACAASRIGGDVLRDAYEGQVRRLAEAYPTSQAFPDNDGM